jgi:filamentous hemagglutinin family protein
VLVELMLFYAPLPVLLANPNPGAAALPSGHDSPSGVSFTPAPSSLTISNVSNGTVINWNNFDIGAASTVTFNQASASAYVLNRVNATDGMATGIMGTLLANGGVIVVNPRGIVIGPDALINAGKFVASGLGITNSDFKNFANGSTDVLKFDGWCNAGNVTNNGTINAAEVYLVGKNVTNTSTGVISCPGGMLVMAAGETVYLTRVGSRVSVEAPSDLITPDGSNNKVTMGGTVNANGAGVLLAAGDIISQAAITGAESFVAKANVNLNVNGALDVQGDVTLYADFDHSLPGDFHSTAPITATGNIDVRGNDIWFGEAVKAGLDLTIKGRDCGESKEWPWGNVTAMKTLYAGGDITISVTGETEESRWVSTGKCGGGYWEYYTVYEPGTIYLYGDVTAELGNITLYNNTYTGPGVTLMAGNNIILANDRLETTPPGYCEWLTGDTWLAMRAGNEIQAPKTVISVTGSTLIMEQGLSLNLDNFLFANQVNTHLTLISDHGSVTAVEMGTKPANAADQWKSIGATADNKDGGEYAINLSGNQKNITATELRAYNDDIMVNAKVAKVLATENVKADTGSITIIGNTGIDVSKNLTAGDGITLDGVVTAVGTSDQDFEAGAGALWAKNTITKTGAGNLNLGGNAGINLDGTVDVKAGSLVIEDDFTAASDLLASGDVTTMSGILDGTTNQRMDAQGGTLWANGTLTKTGAGDLTLGGQTGINLDGTVDVEAGSLIIEDDFSAADDLLANDDVTLYGNGTLDDGVSAQRIDAENGTLWASGTLTKTSAGDLYLGGGTGINLDGTVDVWTGSLIIEDAFSAAGDLLASYNITLNNDATLDGLGAQRIEATSGEVYAGGTVTKTTAGQLSILAGNGITLAGDATAADSMNIDAGLGDVLAQDSLNATAGDLQVRGKNIQVAGTSNAGSDMTMTAGDNITLGGAATAGGNMHLEADEDSDNAGDMWAQSTLTTTLGDIEISASDSTIKLDEDVSAGQNLVLNNNTVVAGGKKLEAGQDVVTAASKTLTGSGDLAVRAGRDIMLGGGVMTAGNMTISANPASSSSNVYADGKLTSDGDMLVEAGADVYLNATPDSAYSGGDMIITASAGYAYGDLDVAGNLEAEGDITLSSSDNTTYLGGDVDAGGNVLLNNNTRFVGWFDQLVQAGGTITANGWLNKINYNHCLGWSDGSLYLHASGDIILGDSVGDDYVKAACFKYDCYGVGGGVSIISDTGSIYTQEADGMLNVPITGRSDHFAYIGVGLPYAPGLAAIVIKSNKDLMLGPSAELTAGGRYYAPELIDGIWNIDDRPGVGFLAEPATIGGYLRDEGDPFDLAIYVASKNGNVDVSGPVTIESRSEPVYAVGEQSLSSIPECPGCEPKGAMVVDAHDSVTFGPDFLSSLGNGDVGDRFEVCSRITEWLEDAITFERLPYADDAAAMSMLWYGNPDSYVLRGAGAENPDIGDGAPAWVLESKEKPTPIEPIEPFAPAAPIQQPELKFTGCPAVMNWVAKELGLDREQLQIYMDSTLAMSSGIQPCDVCARLKNTALVLMDADGTQLKALGQVVNEFAAGGAPPSEEQMAIIATALQNPKEGTQYALAAQWLDALAEYTNILNKDLQLPTDESTSLAAKYTAPVTGGDNAALAAYVQARLATIGG